MSRHLAALLGLIPMLLLPGLAQAQPLTDVVPRDLYTDTMRQDGNSITFCYNRNGMTAAFDQELAEAIGSVLLVEAKTVPLRSNGVPTTPLDYRLPYTAQQLFVLIAEECDAIIGYVLSRNAPEWVRLTRPYLSTGSVLVVRDPAIQRLEDLPLDQSIGSRSMSTADNRLASYLRSLPEAKRWVRRPYYSNERVLEKLNDGSTGAGLVWEPALYFATDGDPQAAGYYQLPLPFQERRTELAIATRSSNTYLNSILGEAIEELIADGTLAEMIDRHHLGPTSLPQQ